MVLRSGLEKFFALFLAVLVLSLASSAAYAQAAPPRTRPVPRKAPATAKPAAAKPAPKPEPEPPYPAIPEAPKTLDLAGNGPLQEGDSWEYLVSSGDAARDATTLRVTLTKVEPKQLTFEFQGGGGEPRSTTVPWDGKGFFGLVTDKDGSYALKMFQPDSPGASQEARDDRDAAGIIDFPLHVEADKFRRVNVGGRWEHNFVTGVRKEWPGSSVEITGPATCVVPAAALACSRFAYQGAGMRLVAYFAPETPAAIRTEFKPVSATGWLLFELQSWQAAGTRRGPEFPDLPKAERQKAIDWLRAKLIGATEGKSYDALGAFQSMLHWEVRLHPRDRVRIFLSPGVTNDHKGYIAEWNAWKFSAREMTPEEIAKEPPESMKSSVELRGGQPAVRN